MAAVRFELNYWRLLRLLVLLNLPALVLGTLGYFLLDAAVETALLRTSLPALCVVVSGTLFGKLVIDAPPTFIEIDKQAHTVSYARFLRFRKVILRYQRVQGEFTTRSGGKAGPIKGWSLLENGRELFFVAFRANVWTEAQLKAVDSHLKHSN